MGTALTGSTVASTYTGLLKTTDSATLTSSLKAISDGSGTDSALQVSTQAVNTSGDFSVATNKLTVASASGNTAVAGTLGVTGATTLSSTLGVTGAATLASVAVTGAATAASVATTGNISTSAGNISAPAGTISSRDAISQTLAGQNNNLAGNLAVGGNLNVTGVTTLSGNVSLPGNLAVTGDFSVNTNKFNVAASSGNTLVAGTLGVTGDTTLVNLSTTGNSTLGNDSSDSVLINSNDVRYPNMPASVAVDFSNDKVLILDASDSSKTRTVAASSLGISSSNAPQCVQNIYRSTTEYATNTSAPGVEISAITTSITPRSSSSNVLVMVSINYSKKTSANWSYYAVFRLTRTVGAVVTEIGTSTTGATLSGIAPIVYYNDADSNLLNNVTFAFLDSPGTASAATYKVHVYSPGLTDTLIINTCPSANAGNLTTPSIARVSSSMTLQEFFA